MLHDQAIEGARAVGGQLPIQRPIQTTNRSATVHHVAAVGARDQIALADGGGIGGEFAHDLFQDVFQRYQSQHFAVLVHHQPDAPAQLLKVDQLPGQRGAFRDEVRFPDQVFQIGSVEIRLLHHHVEHLAQVQEAHDLIEGVAIDQHAGVGAAGQFGDDLRPVAFQVDALHLVAWHHDVIDGDFLQLQDAQQHGLMPFGNHYPGFEHHRAQFLGTE